MSEARDVLDRAREVTEFLFAQEWSDGLPVVPATPAGVEAMLRGTRRDRDEVIGALAPGWGKATVERIAVNGLMAGCKPEYMPVLIAAVQAVADERYGLQGTQGTTDCIAPLLVVNGPTAGRLGFNGGAGCFGHGTRANATVGRAICLMLLTLGGALPGRMKKSTLSQPGTYSYCIAENAAASPWEPLHVERGFSLEASTVTAMAATPMYQVSDHCNATAEGFLTTLCDFHGRAGELQPVPRGRERRHAPPGVHGRVPPRGVEQAGRQGLCARARSADNWGDEEGGRVGSGDAPSPAARG